MERFSYAAIGAVFGVVVGAVCWWLYGLAFSRQYSGPGLDPNLLHWAKAAAAIFAALGFLFKDKVGSAVGTVLAAILHFESGQHEERHLGRWQIVLVLLLLAGLAWYIYKH